MYANRVDEARLNVVTVLFGHEDKKATVCTDRIRRSKDKTVMLGQEEQKRNGVYRWDEQS